jgi:para-nitrobenzyl esterase
MSDIPLLLGSKQAWEQTSFVGPDAWPEVEVQGRELRRIWAEFARTGTVPADASPSGALTFDRG